MKKTKNKQNNQRSFYFNEYNQNILYKKKNDTLYINQDRLYVLFFIFFCLIFLFSIKIFFVSLKTYDSENFLKSYNNRGPGFLKIRIACGDKP